MTALTSLVTQVVPVALGSAVSPTSLMVLIILLSSSKNPKLSGIGFYTGSIIILLLTIFLGFLLHIGATQATGGHSNTSLEWIDIIIGFLLVYLGLKSFFKKPKPPEDKVRDVEEESRSKVVIFSRGMEIGLGIFLINFSTTLLVFDASRHIASSAVPWDGKLMVIIVLILISLILVEVPLLLYLLIPDRADVILSGVNVWMKKNGHYLAGVVFIVIGLYIALKGVGALALI
jgi:threonine/homoserine/homoserine lactone efflux protein